MSRSRADGLARTRCGPHPRFGAAHQIWHNGGTGGFRSRLGFVPGGRAGVVVLTNTARPPDAQAFDLLRVLAFGGHLRAGRR